MAPKSCSRRVQAVLCSTARAAPSRPEHSWPIKSSATGGGRTLRHAGGGTIHDAVHAIALTLETGEHRPVKHPPSRQLDSHRIDQAAVDQHLVVQMCTCREAGRSHIADDLALANAYPGLDAASKRRHVAVGRLVTVGVAQTDILAIARFPSGLVDGAIARCVDRRSVGSGPIDAGVHLHVAEDRVAAYAEA